MPVLMRKNGFKTGISVARIDFTHEYKTKCPKPYLPIHPLRRVVKRSEPLVQYRSSG
ncbi:hypothetical protein HMPREF3214_00172 [Alloscardovia omnicolens]|nr:hypothetical protein HMPREF3214_00172 [Alloscardovia omnicolens]